MPKRTLLLGLFLICTTLLIFTWMVRDSLCDCTSDRRKRSWRQCWLTKQNVSSIGGKFSPPLQKWLSLNAPLSMARALRAIALTHKRRLFFS